MIKQTKEHIVGTRHGSLKCRAISPSDENKRFDPELFVAMRGAPWKPSPRHEGWKLKTDLEDEEGYTEECPEEIFKAKIDWNEDVDEAIRIIRESRKLCTRKRESLQGFTSIATM